MNLIEDNNGPKDLDISHADLSEVDLSSDVIIVEMERREIPYDAPPPWYSAVTRGINLRGAILRECDLSGARLWRGDFRGTDLEAACLRGADLGIATMNGADLTQANLDAAILSRVELRDADLTQAILTDTDLEDVDLTAVHSLEGVYLAGANLDNTNIRQHQLLDCLGEVRERDYHGAREAYLALKNNFLDLGRYNEAAWAYRGERRMEKREAWQEAREALEEGEWKTFVSKAWKVGWDLVVQYLCGYGESLGRVLGWMGFVLFIAGPLLFGLPGLLDWEKEEYNAYFDLPFVKRHVYAYVQYFLYVLDAFTTANFAELEAATALARVFSGLTALVGVFLTGLLGFVAGNRIRRS